MTHALQELIDMEIKCERLCIMYHNDATGNNKGIKQIRCARPKCAHGQHYMGNMETHLNWHNELKNRYDLFTLSVNP